MTTDPASLLSLADTAVDLVIARLAGVDRAAASVVGTKSSATDLVTEYDRWCEETLTATLADARPGDGFLGEEGTDRPSTTGVTWVIDPIDGTTNFVYDLPGSSVSVAARIDGIDTVGVVHDLVRGERYRASLGAGATLDGRPIRASAETSLPTALVATGFSYDADRRRAQAEVLAEIVPEVRDIRRFGGAAIDLCLVACGRVDAYYERALNDWDVAAGGLIAREAGAEVDDRRADHGAYAAVAPGIADEFLALLERAGAHRP